MPQQVELRTDPHITTRDNATVTPEDAHNLHEWVEEYATVDDPVTVAVMDTGIHANTAENHPWFENATVAKRHDAVANNPGADKVGHGTGCASIIAENTPEVELYDVRIFGKKGRTGFDAIRKAYEWMIDHADEIDIVNMSWGAGKDVPAINQLHEKLVRVGVHDVVAAGNTGGEGGSPSTSKKAFSAGAVDATGDLTRFTSRDPKQDNPDVAAVGKNVKMARAPGASMGTPLNDQFVKACMPSQTQVLTSDGWTTIQALHSRKELPKAVTFNTRTGEFEESSIVRTLRREMDDDESLYRISTDEGHYVEATGNHQFLTSRGYVRADELVEGDEIITRPDAPDGKKTPLMADKRHVHECAECGELFSDRKKDRIYCSKACKGGDASRFPDTAGENNPNHKDRVEVVCEYCGTEQMVTPSRAEEYRFCSSACFGKHRSEQDEDFGKYLTEWQENNPERHRELVENDAFVEQQGNADTLPHDSETARKAARAAHEKVMGMSMHDETSLEADVREMLDAIGVEYEQEYVVVRDDGGMLTSVDFALPERKVAIYADGDYWHNYPEGTERDSRIGSALESRGWEVIRLWESDVEENPAEAKRRLSKAVTNGAEVIGVEEVEDKPVYDITTEPNHNFVANGLVVHNSGTSFAAPYTVAAYVNALYAKRRSWDRAFERAAPDIPGSKADGEGLLKLRLALSDSGGDGGDGDQPAPNPKTDASIWTFLGGDTMFLSADWLPGGDTVAEKVEETKDAVTLRVRK